MKHEITLPQDLEDFVQEISAQDQSTDVNHVIVESLYLMKDEFDHLESDQARLRSELQRAVEQADQGHLTDGRTFMAQLLERIRARAGAS